LTVLHGVAGATGSEGSTKCELRAEFGNSLRFSGDDPSYRVGRGEKRPQEAIAMARATSGVAVRHLSEIFGKGSAAGMGDGELLARYADSNEEMAFEALVQRHGPMVLATCRAVLRNEHDIEDAFQATFLVLARKAGTIRVGDALGGWLHRVAYRASVEASLAARRRRRTETEARAMAPPDATDPGPDVGPDWSTILHEELDRLPDGQRLPVVLCDLEGLTYERAAGQLGWSVAKFRSRLARARRRLRDRLTRRGVQVSGAVPLLAPPGAPAAPAPVAVPPALVRATVAAATGGPSSVGAAILARILLRGMLMTKIQIGATAALAAVGVITAGAGVRNDPQPVKEPEAPPPAAREAAGKEDTTPSATVEIRGVVVDPEGKPVAGAAIRAFSSDLDSAVREATSRPDGRFAIRLPKPNEALLGYMADYPWIIASAPGFGIGWATGVSHPDDPAERKVTLTPEGPPIEGRIIDLEGRPVTGARVKLSAIWYDQKQDMAAWIARARKGAEGNLWQGLHLQPLDRLLTIEARTGPDGRFRLTGAGRDRIADLLITGEGIATTPVKVFSRPEPELRTDDRGMMVRTPLLIHAPKFQLAVPRSKRVEGVIRDRDSGRPIAGLEIKAAVFDEHSLIPAEGIEAKTDAQGRYRLDGLPRAPAYRLFLEPGKGLPYAKATLRVAAETPAFEPVAFDLAMKRGILVRGKATEKGTGLPVLGTASYYAFQDNPHLKDYPGFSQGGNPQWAPIDEQGRYEVVALPGRGLVTIRDDMSRSRPVTVPAGTRGFDAKYQAFLTVPQWANLGNFTAYVEVDLDPDSAPTTRDLHTDPGRSVTVEVVGPDGRPLGETKVKGMSDQFLTSPVPQVSARFEVHALAPGHPRRMVVMHEGRKLIGSVLLRGDEDGPVVVKLEPWGSVSGRIVDDEGRPRKGMFLGSPDGSTNKRPETDDILPWSDWNNGIRAADDGRFAVEGLVPGLHYSATSRSGFEVPGTLFKDVVVAPGEAKDLGDLKVQPLKKQEE
jgi:RNA polymerase sigma factor (sigma-70 family)